MSKQIVMKNPDLNPIVMDLETPIWTLRQIWAEDRKAGKTDYAPTDSTVKSAIRRTMGHLKNRPPKPLPQKKEKDQWLHNLTLNLWQACQDHLNQSTSRKDLLVCLAAIEDSIKTHTVGDARGYLEFLDGFFAEMGATTEEVDEETALQILDSQ
jgi:hypothetical protein